MPATLDSPTSHAETLSPPQLTAMLDKAALALDDCMSTLSDVSHPPPPSPQPGSSDVASAKAEAELKLARAAYCRAQAALMQSRAVESSLRALSQLQKIQQTQRTLDQPVDHEARALRFCESPETVNADREARIRARVRLMAEAKYANAKSNAEIDELGWLPLTQHYSHIVNNDGSGAAEPTPQPSANSTSSTAPDLPADQSIDSSDPSGLPDLSDSSDLSNPTPHPPSLSRVEGSSLSEDPNLRPLASRPHFNIHDYYDFEPGHPLYPIFGSNPLQNSPLITSPPNNRES